MARIVTFAGHGAPDVQNIEDVALLEPGGLDEVYIAVKAIGLERIANWRRTSISAGS
jgi:hypothetical protein